MPTIITRGAASAQALGFGSSSAAVNYIEDVFSTYLYTANGSPLTINNGIDLAGKGGLVWVKNRTGVASHTLTDSVTGVGKRLFSDTTGAQLASGGATNFTSTGFDPGATGGSDSYATWTFREQPKFFDIVTFTGNSVAGRQIPHNLNSVPGMILLKSTNVSGPWYVYHRSDPTKYGVLNSTAAFSSFSAQTVFGNNTTTVAPTSTVFTVGTDSTVNNSGDTYVAYLFAHDAGGFGLTGTDNVISCGSYNRTDGVKSVVNLGYEPQFIIQKTATAGSQWTMLDVMRGWTGASNSNLFANLSNAESTGNIGIMPTATGFEDYTTAGATDTIIYIAIRRGPMKVPTDATKVFTPIALNPPADSSQAVNFPVDLSIGATRDASGTRSFTDRLRGYPTTNAAGSTPTLRITTNAESLTYPNIYAATNASVKFGFDLSGQNIVEYFFRRAPGFFDEVCYTGAGGTRTINHNLNVAPEMMILKARSGAANWEVYHKDLNALGTQTADDSRINLNTVNAATASNTIWNSTPPTASVFSIGNNNDSNQPGITFVNYLFATCSGVSKVGSYTGTGTTQTINCGFTSGARFVMIKRADSTGDWYVWDSARGIVAGNDPYLLLNSTAAEVTGTDYVDTASSGFEISSTAPAAINANGGSFIFLAIA